MRRILVVGGANGIGLSIVKLLSEESITERVYVVDKALFQDQYKNEKIHPFQFDLTTSDYSFFDQFQDIDALMITAGFGKLSLLRDLDETVIASSFNVNTIPVLRLIKRFYPKLESKENFYCGVMVSIAGFMSSPLFSVYAATKAALKIFIESVNVELIKAGSLNRILNVSPGSIQGTNFSQGETNLDVLRPLTSEIIQHLKNKDDLFIPQYDEVFKNVLQRYHEDFRKEGLHSYDYKVQKGRIRLDK